MANERSRAQELRSEAAALERAADAKQQDASCNVRCTVAKQVIKSGATIATAAALGIPISF